MDEPDEPTAAELGISDLEYERIMRDLRRRELRDVPVPGPARAPASAPAAAPAAAPARRRSSKLVALALIGPIVVVAVLARLGAAGTKPAYAFFDTVGGRPVTYSSCHPIQVAIYPAGGPPNAVELVRQAVVQLRADTGLDIAVSGVFGGHAPNWDFEAAAPVGPEDPISVSWQDGQAIANLTDHVAGVGGSRIFIGNTGTKYFAAGTIALSRESYATLNARGDRAEELAVLLHEFGHVFGLAHVDSPGELMYRKNIGRTTFGPGDLQGLRLLGQGPCI